MGRRFIPATGYIQPSDTVVIQNSQRVHSLRRDIDLAVCCCRSNKENFLVLYKFDEFLGQFRVLFSQCGFPFDCMVLDCGDLIAHHSVSDRFISGMFKAEKAVLISQFPVLIQLTRDAFSV